MWSLLPPRVRLMVIVGSTLLLAWALDAAHTLVLGGTPRPLKWLAFIVFFMEVVAVLILNWGWRRAWRRMPLLNRWFPDLNGAWEGTLRSTWADPTTQAVTPAKPVTVTVRQTFFDVTVTLQSETMQSHSTRAFLDAFPNFGRYRIGYAYVADPPAGERHRNPPHKGTAHLDWQSDEPNELTGGYFTDRNTSGELKLRRRQEG